MKKIISTSTLALYLIVCSSTCSAQAIVEAAAIREEIRQQTTWTSENIAKNPYLFIQDQIRQCDVLSAKITAQNITMTRLSKETARKVEEADGMIARYTKLLAAFNAAYDGAEKNGKWPVTVNGYEMDEEELCDKIDDTAMRIEFAKNDKKQNAAIGKKVAIRQGVLKKKKREVINLRLKLVQQAEQLKMNEALAEIEGLKDVLGMISDMMVEIDEDPTKLTVEDLSADNPDDAKKDRIRAIRGKDKDITE